MNNYTLSYREVIPDQTVNDSWKETTIFSLNIGGTQSTLQDIKVAERANGYCYKDATKYYTRNRFIYWRINHDILELTEHSLDVNLSGNRISYKFIDTPILHGVTIYEARDKVIILVPTVCSVHRLTFPHPENFQRKEEVLAAHLDLALPSIFTEASLAEARNPNNFHFFTHTPTNNALPYVADSYLNLHDEEAYFLYAYPSGQVLLIKHHKNGQIECHQLKEDSYVPKFLSGLAEKLRQKEKDYVIDLLLCECKNEVYAMVLYRNGYLKVWSCTTNQYINYIDVNIEIKSKREILNYMLRKNTNQNESLIAIYTNFENDSEINIFRITIAAQEVQLICLNKFCSLHNDLIDFAVCPTSIWVIWREINGLSMVYTAPLHFDNGLTPVILENIPDPNQIPNIDSDMDLRQAYLQQIFYPGRFPLHIISKALNIYKRSAVVGDINITSTILKQQITLAVEEEIHNELKETVVSDEDYLECASHCWQRLYSCCVQYHVAGLKPLGILLLPSVSGAVLLKKSNFSFLRPVDLLEHLIFANDNASKYQIDKCEDLDLDDDFLTLCHGINYLEEQLSDEFVLAFEKELLLLQPSNVVMEKMLDKILSEIDNEFADYLLNKLSNCSDLYQAMHKMLELLQDNPDDFMGDSMVSNGFKSEVNHIFSSKLGVSFVSESLKQQIKIRFMICRNLLLIVNLLMKKGIKWNILEAVRSVCTPEIVLLTQSTFIMLWLSSLPALNNSIQETTAQRLIGLRLSPVFNVKNGNLQTVSILELFIGSTGGYEARKLFSQLEYNEENLIQWHTSLLPFLKSIFHIIWPMNGPPILNEWLLSCGQHLYLQQCVRLMKNWCEWNNCSHNFLIAVSLLVCGENYKAQDFFEKAAKGIFTEEFLARLIAQDANENHLKAYINYYLKIIYLFELHKAYDCAINLADVVLTIVGPEDALSATLYSIKFKHHLTLKHYNLAYDSLNANPDSDRKKDNLRDLVKKLLDEKKFDVLMQFTYGNLEELFCEIIFARARATDAINNVYYDFLYAYHIKRSPTFLRLAASVMYEQAFRLNQIDTPESLEKQFKCLLAAKNALQLCNKLDSWIVIPKEQIEEELIALPSLVGSNQPPEKIVVKTQIEIVNLDDLRKELILANAKLRLSQVHTNSSLNLSNINELVVLLTNSGMFKTALEVCKMFDLSYQLIFEILTKRCVQLTKQSNPNAWKWLIENDLDLPANTKNASEVAWNLLQTYVEKYEEDKLSTIHYIVCRQIIKMNMFVPHWLLASYKKRNPAELLRLFHYAGRFEEAMTIAVEYMMAALGYGKEYYGFSHSMLPTAPPLCLPVQEINILIQHLRIINEKDSEKIYKKEYENLCDVFKTYCQTACRTTNEMCQYKMSYN